jgi:hypothetical protein
MAGDDFFKTRMGQRFYEATMPSSPTNSSV